MTVRTTAALLGAMLVASTAGAQGKTRQGKDRRRARRPQVQHPERRLGAGVGGLRRPQQVQHGHRRLASDPKYLVAAVKELSGAPDKPGTEVARQWVLGQTLVTFTLIDGHPTAGARKSFGYVSDPEASIDILLAADSAFKAVEAASPGCKSQIDPMRRMAVIAATNAATAQFNAGNLDSAAVLATACSSCRKTRRTPSTCWRTSR